LVLEVYILTFVRSLRESDFDMYLDTLWELLPWFFALDHTHYARYVDSSPFTRYGKPSQDTP